MHLIQATYNYQSQYARYAIGELYSMRVIIMEKLGLETELKKKEYVKKVKRGERSDFGNCRHSLMTRRNKDPRVKFAFLNFHLELDLA